MPLLISSCRVSVSREEARKPKNAAWGDVVGDVGKAACCQRDDLLRPAAVLWDGGIRLESV